MANLALLQNNVVRYIVPAIQYAPAGAVYNSTRDASGASVGDTWNGSAYVRPPVPVEQANEQIIRDQAEVAIGNLRTERDRSYAGLSTAAAVALLVPAVKLLCRVLIGVLRLQLNKHDGTD